MHLRMMSANLNHLRSKLALFTNLLTYLPACLCFSLPTTSHSYTCRVKCKNSKTLNIFTGISIPTVASLHCWWSLWLLYSFLFCGTYRLSFADALSSGRRGTVGLVGSCPFIFLYALPLAPAMPTSLSRHRERHAEGTLKTTSDQKGQGKEEDRHLDLELRGLKVWPPGVSKLSRLQTLNLSYNFLSSLPDSLWFQKCMPLLEEVNLAHNQLLDFRSTIVKGPVLHMCVAFLFTS